MRGLGQHLADMVRTCEDSHKKICGMACTEQTTLDEFADLGFEDQICRARELVLPGPDWDGCC